MEDTLLDLANAAETFDDVYAWVTRAFQRRLTNEAMAEVARVLRLNGWQGWLRRCSDSCQVSVS